MDSNVELDFFKRGLKSIEWLENYFGINNIFSENGELLINERMIYEKEFELFKEYNENIKRNRANASRSKLDDFKFHSMFYYDVVDKIKNGYEFGEKNAIDIFKEWRENKINNVSSASAQQEIVEQKKRRRKGNAKPLFAGENPEDIVNSIDEVVDNIANGRTERKFNNPRMDPKVVSQTMEHVKDATIVNNGMPDDEGFFEAVERHTQSPIKTVSNPKNGYNEFESLMNELKNGGDVDSIKSQIKGSFRNNTQKYTERYIQENYNGAYEQYVKDVETMFDGDPDADGFYESIERVNKDSGRDFNLVDVDIDDNGNINIDKLADDLANGNTRTVNANTIVRNKERQINYNQRAEANRKNLNSHEKELKRKKSINGAKDQREFEEIIYRKENESIEELRRKANDKTISKSERKRARKKLAIEKEANDLYDAKTKTGSKNKKERKKARKKMAEEFGKDRGRAEELIKIGEMNAEEARLQKEYDEILKKVNDPTLSKKERKLARRERANHEFAGGVDAYRNRRIKNTDRNIVEGFLDSRYDINSNINDYNQVLDDLDLAGSDYLDIDGNELGRVNKFINKTFRKAELKVKGFFKGDYSEYDEYVEAVERLKNMQNRDFKFYDTDNLFDSNGHLNNADDILNLNPSETTTSKDIFDDWQNARRSAATSARKNTTSASNGSAISKENLLRSHPNAKKLFTAQGVFGVGMNLFNTVSTYKEERKEGKSVLGSAARAGLDFALGEVLGMKYMGVMAAQALPRMAVKGLEGLGKLTREKNNMQRHEAFGYASFQDTQQLATMRQSGMEMAKMANYNLQQTLMGNEAKYMHR